MYIFTGLLVLIFEILSEVFVSFSCSSKDAKRWALINKPLLIISPRKQVKIENINYSILCFSKNPFFAVYLKTQIVRWRWYETCVVSLLSLDFVLFRDHAERTINSPGATEPQTTTCETIWATKTTENEPINFHLIIKVTMILRRANNCETQE